MNVEVYGSFTKKVSVNPISVLEELKTKELKDSRSWVFEKDGKYYRGFEVGGGTHSWDDSEEITKEKYELVKAIDLWVDHLKKK